MSAMPQITYVEADGRRKTLDVKPLRSRKREAETQGNTFTI